MLVMVNREEGGCWMIKFSVSIKLNFSSKLVSLNVSTKSYRGMGFAMISRSLNNSDFSGLEIKPQM
jgi:hypothetical protein